MNIAFNKYEPTEKEFLWNTYVAAMKDHIENIWGWDNVWQKNDFENNLKQYDTNILYYQNEPIGYLQTRDNADSTFINMLILKTNYQSKGLGRWVINKIQLSRPNTPLELKCFRVNDAAFRFYISTGFSVVENDDEHFICMRKNNA